jgi:DNA-binding MltR family transcriptional regulator
MKIMAKSGEKPSLAKKGKYDLSKTGIDRMITALEKESDRGYLLIMSAMLDEVLRLLLRNFMLNNEREKGFKDKLFENDGPLSTFSSRIRVAFGLGLLDPDLYADLQIFREIRNQFAHQFQAISFETSSIRDRIHNLKYLRKELNLDNSQFMEMRSAVHFSFAGMLTTLVIELNENRKTLCRPLNLMSEIDEQTKSLSPAELRTKAEELHEEMIKQLNLREERDKLRQKNNH